MAFLVKLLCGLCVAGCFGEIRESLKTSLELDEPFLVEDIEAKITDRKGFTCTYYEVRKPGPGPRTLRISCSKKTNCGEEKEECDYKGQPHDCRWYNKKGNQPIFYEEMAEKLANEPGGICSAADVEIDRCPGVVFRRQ